MSTHSTWSMPFTVLRDIDRSQISSQQTFHYHSLICVLPQAEEQQKHIYRVNCVFQWHALIPVCACRTVWTGHVTVLCNTLGWIAAWNASLHHPPRPDQKWIMSLVRLKIRGYSGWVVLLRQFTYSRVWGFEWHKILNRPKQFFFFNHSKVVKC